MRENKDIVVNPIYEWTDTDVWEYIRRENIDINPLYERGYKRVGCIGCPLASYSDKVKEFSDYPKYKEAYIRAFQRMVDKRERMGKNEGMRSWTDGQGVFDWWMQEYKDKCRGQMTLDNYV
jgi:phosphoadenosine phosphosulfate reductase